MEWSTHTPLAHSAVVCDSSNAGTRRDAHDAQPRALSLPCFAGRAWSRARMNGATWCVPARLLPDRWARIVRMRLHQRALSHRVGVHVLADHFNRHGAHMATIVFMQHPERLGKH